MASWGENTYDCDEVMDRVGDIWRSVFDQLDVATVSRLLGQALRREMPNGMGALLWRYCTVELSDSLISRLGCLMTTDPNIAREIIDSPHSIDLSLAIESYFDCNPSQTA